MAIKDSGIRREFDSGAVRDIQEGKGRCDLLPLDVAASLSYGDFARILTAIERFKICGEVSYLRGAIDTFSRIRYGDIFSMLLEASKHFEEGAKKYGEYNWQKGIPVHCYIDSAVRHFLKWLRGDEDEPHDRAFCWNLLCAVWTCKNLPHLNDYAVKDGGSNDQN